MTSIMIKVNATCASRGISSGLKYIFVSNAKGLMTLILAEVLRLVGVLVAARRKGVGAKTGREIFGL